MTFGKAINKSWGHSWRGRAKERVREGIETYAYLNIQIVALIYEMWQKQKAKKAVYIELARYYEYVTETMCGGENKNAKTIMRNIFRYGHLSRTAAGQLDPAHCTLAAWRPLFPCLCQLPNKMGQQFVWFFFCSLAN